MIKINNEVLEISHYPDNTQKIIINDKVLHAYRNNISWNYQNDEEFVTLIFVTEHIREIFPDSIINLYLPYIPNARMDRVHHKPSEVFTLKYFCKFINNLNFNNVFVMDAHSNVSIALLDRCIQDKGEYFIRKTIGLVKEDSNSSDVLLYFPDSGAFKKYSELLPEFKYCYGEKKRDWDTGKILGLEVKAFNEDITGKTVLMIDDIISYGGSMYYGAKELKNLGASKIYAYATHVENSILDKEKGTLIKSLEDGTVEKLFTTNSIYTGNHDKIILVEEK